MPKVPTLHSWWLVQKLHVKETNKITERIIDKITDRIKKDLNNRLAQKKMPRTASVSCSKIKHPLSFFFFSSFLLFFFSKFLQLFFYTWNRVQTDFFLHKVWKKQKTRTRTKQRHNQEHNKTQTRKQIIHRLLAVDENLNKIIHC